MKGSEGGSSWTGMGMVAVHRTSTEGICWVLGAFQRSLGSFALEWSVFLGNLLGDDSCRTGGKS